MIVCLQDESERRLFMRAYDKGFSPEEYVFLTARLVPEDRLEGLPWVTCDGKDNIAKEAYRSVIEVSRFLDHLKYIQATLHFPLSSRLCLHCHFDAYRILFGCLQHRNPTPHF